MIKGHNIHESKHHCFNDKGRNGKRTLDVEVRDPKHFLQIMLIAKILICEVS